MLKFQKIAKVGDYIRAYDFRPMGGTIMNHNRVVVFRGVVRYIETGLVPELYELEEMLAAKRITRQELDTSSKTRTWEMVES